MAGESPSGASAAPHWPRKRLPAPPPLAPEGCSLRGRGALSRRRRCSPPPRGRARREEARALDGSGSPALPLATAPASAPPPSRGKRQSERVRRRQRAGPERRGRGLLAVTPPCLLAPLRSPPSARRPPLPTRARTSLGLGFPGAPPWTSGSPPRDAVLPLRSRLQWPGGVRRAGMRRAWSPEWKGQKSPAPGDLSSRVPPRTIGMTWGVPKSPFNGPPKGGCRRVRRSEDWGAGFEGRGQTALGELFPETLRSPARFLRPPHRISLEKAPQQFFSCRLCSFLSRRGDPRTACSEGGHTSQHPASVPPLSEGSGSSPRFLGHRS